MQRDLPNASRPPERPRAKYGKLSLLCFLGGFGLGFFFFFVGAGIGGRVGQLVGLVATELVFIAWLIGAVFGVRGVCRREESFGSGNSEKVAA